MRLFVQLLNASNFRKFLCSSERSSFGYLLTSSYISRSNSSSSLNSSCEELTKLTVKDAISNWTKLFVEKDIPEPESSIENIMAHILGFSKISLVHACEKQKLSKKQVTELEKCCECRLARMPVQYIIKEWSFRHLNLAMVPPVFIPRPETESLLDLIFDDVRKRNYLPENVLEVGCGTGAIILSLLLELPNIREAYAVDKSRMACLLTMRNGLDESERLKICNIELKEDGTFSSPQNHSEGIPSDFKFNIIVSNPPYIPSKRIPGLEPEVKLYEDLRALDGGPDGMKIIKALMIYAAKNLVDKGSLFMEIDHTQPELITNWIKSNRDEYKLDLIKISKDFNKKYRYVHFIKQ